MNFVEQFAKELQRPTPEPERLALAIAGLAYPTLNPGSYLAQLDEMAAVVQHALLASPPGQVRAIRFLDAINEQLGFTGNRDNYYDPENSFLNRVMERRVGLPIMLSLICMAIGRRLDLDVSGIGLPGHFMARYRDEAGVWLLDPFHGQVLNQADAAIYLSDIFAQPINLPTDAYTAVTASALAQRILQNLRGVYLNQRDFAMTARVMDYLLVLAPSNPLLWRDRGLLHHYSQQWEPAARDLRRYFFLTGHFIAAMGWEKESKPPVGTFDQQDRQVLDIFQQVEKMRHRIN